MSYFVYPSILLTQISYPVVNKQRYLSVNKMFAVWYIPAGKTARPAPVPWLPEDFFSRAQADA